MISVFETCFLLLHGGDLWLLLSCLTLLPLPLLLLLAGGALPHALLVVLLLLLLNVNIVLNVKLIVHVHYVYLEGALRPRGVLLASPALRHGHTVRLEEPLPLQAVRLALPAQMRLAKLLLSSQGALRGTCLMA